MRRFILAGSLAALVACAGSTPSQHAAPATANSAVAVPAPHKIQTIEGITEYRLSNGLQVLLFPDPSQDKLTVNVTYFVGSRHEGYGEAGMAHLLEHMVFKGTPTHPNIWNLLKQHGAVFNGTTWVDRTNYYETLPASADNLEFAIAMEADRMVNSSIAKDELSREFSVVRNEFEMGENNPMGVLMERMLSTAYLWHNYGKSTIGNRSDIERVPVDNLRAFYRKYYQPDNAMLVIAGKFDQAKALSLVHQHFGAIAKPTRELARTYTREPVQDGEREVVLRRTGDTQVVGLVYHGVSGPHEDYLPIQAVAHILTDEPSGRLYKALVETGMASSVSGFSWPTREPGTILFLAEVPADKPLAPVERTLISVVEGLSEAKITDAEVKRFINRSKKDTALFWADSQAIAIRLTEYSAQGDWRLLFLHRDNIDSVTKDKVVAAAGKYLKRSNRTLGRFVPTASPERAPLPEQPDVLAMVDGYKGKQVVSSGEKFVASISNIEARTVRGALDNGMKLALLSRQTRGDKVMAMLTLRFGSERELNGTHAAADLLPQMLLRGTKRHSYQQLRDEFDRLKASVSFGQGGPMAGITRSPNSVTVRVETVREHLPEVVSLVAEILQQPAFPADQFKVLRQETLTALQGQRQDPTAQGFLEMFRAINPHAKSDIRYIPSTAESIERVKKLKLADMRAFHSRYYGASHGELAVVGDFDAEELKGLLAQHFGSWTSRRPFKRIATDYVRTVPRMVKVNTPDKAMALIGAGHQIKLRDDNPKYPGLVMLGYIMGGNADSRMMKRLRHQEGLSYGAFGFASADAHDEVGIVGAGAIVAPQNVNKAMGMMIEELDKLVRDGVSEDELAEAKASYAKQFKQRLASDQYVLAQLARGLYLGRTLDWQRALNVKLQTMSAAELNAQIPSFIRTDELIKLNAGDASKM